MNAGAIAIGVLAGCTADPSLAAGNGTGYVAGNGELAEPLNGHAVTARPQGSGPGRYHCGRMSFRE